MKPSLQTLPLWDKPTLLILWLSLLCYAIFLAPKAPDEIEFAIALFTFQNASANIVLFAILCLMMLWPFILAPLLLYTNRYRLRPWPFWFASFFLGYFAMAPYVFLRGRRSEKTLPERPRFWQWWRNRMLSKIYGVITAGMALALLALAVLYRDLESFMILFNHYGIVHVMTLDFLALHLLAVVLILQDQTGDNFYTLKRHYQILICLLPAFGPALYPVLKHGTQ